MGRMGRARFFLGPKRWLTRRRLTRPLLLISTNTLQSRSWLYLLYNWKVWGRRGHRKQVHTHIFVHTNKMYICVYCTHKSIFWELPLPERTWRTSSGCWSWPRYSGSSCLTRLRGCHQCYNRHTTDEQTETGMWRVSAAKTRKLWAHLWRTSLYGLSGPVCIAEILNLEHAHRKRFRKNLISTKKCNPNYIFCNNFWMLHYFPSFFSYCAKSCCFVSGSILSHVPSEVLNFCRSSTTYLEKALAQSWNGPEDSYRQLWGRNSHTERNAGEDVPTSGFSWFVGLLSSNTFIKALSSCTSARLTLQEGEEEEAGSEEWHSLLGGIHVDDEDLPVVEKRLRVFKDVPGATSNSKRCFVNRDLKLCMEQVSYHAVGDEGPL